MRDPGEGLIGCVRLGSAASVKAVPVHLAMKIRRRGQPHSPLWILLLSRLLPFSVACCRLTNKSLYHLSQGRRPESRLEVLDEV